MIKNEVFSGERPLYRKTDLELVQCTFEDGESALKESSKIVSRNCDYKSKYPMWHCNDIFVENSFFDEGGRAAIWYSHNIVLKNSKVVAPKIFRDASYITIEDSQLETSETLWDCHHVTINNTNITGDYLLFHCNDIELNNFSLVGNYSMQHTENMVIRNSEIHSKDAFWNSKNVTVYDSIIDGQYLGWYSENLTLINCKISGTQSLCYAKALKVINCEMVDTDLSFELSEVEVDVTSVIESIKNPKSGFIRAKGIKEIIMEKSEVDPNKTVIELDAQSFMIQ